MEQPALLQMMLVLLGALLSGYLVYLFIRKNFQPLLVLLGTSMFFWFGGQFLVDGIQSIGWSTNSAFGWSVWFVSFAGLALESPLLLHVLVHFYREETGASLPDWIMVPIYLPLLLMLPAAFPAGTGLLSDKPLVGALPLFLGTKTAYVLAAAALCLLIRNHTQRQDVAYFTIRFPFVLLSGLLVVYGVYGTTGLERGEYLSALAYSSPLLPLLFVFWTIHRYHLLDVEVTDRSVLAFSFLLTVFLYFITIRHLGRWLERKYTMNPEAMEVMLFLVATVLMTVGGRWMLKVTGSRVRRNSFQVLDDLADRLALSEIDRESGIRLVSEKLEQAFDAPVEVFRHDDRPSVFDCFDDLPRRPYTVTDGQKDELVQELRTLNAFVAIPLTDQERILAVITLGPRSNYLNYTPEELEGISLVMRQFTEAVKTHDLLNEYLALERQLQEEEKLAALGNVAASCAHEVKNPLSSINGIVSSMEEELPEDDPHRRDIEVIKDEIDRLTDVVHDILDFARKGADSMGRVNVSEIVRSVVYVLGRAPEGTRVEHSMPDESVFARAVESDLKGILFNLLLNAVEASPPGEDVRVKVNQDRHDVRITIRNRGEPPDQELLDMIRNESTPSTVQHRNGFGLSIVMNQLDEMEASLDVEIDGDWTTFEVRLPAADA